MYCRPVCIIPIPTWIWRYWQIRTSWCGFCSKMTSDVSRGYSYHFWIFFPAFATTVRNASGRAERRQAVREAVTIRQGWLGGRTEGRKIGEMMRGLVLLYHIRYLTTYPLTYILSYEIYTATIYYISYLRQILATPLVTSYNAITLICQCCKSNALILPVPVITSTTDLQ